MMRIRSRTALVIALFAAHMLAGCAAGTRSPGPEPLATSARWVAQPSGTTASLRGLSVVDESVAWASGSGGTFALTRDGGANWTTGTVPDAAELDFRDVQAVSADTACLMSAGKGDRSRIYKTTDGGRTWTLQYTNPHPQGFFDGMAFWDADRGIAFSDPVDGRFLVITTADGGRTWTPVPPASLPPALPGEAAFAASGTGIAVQPGGHVWFGTGGGSVARVFRSTDWGRTWLVSETPLQASASAGIFSLAFCDPQSGVAVGGDYQQPNQASNNVAVTEDGGRTWTRIAGTAPGGYRSGVAYVPGTPSPTLIAVGTSGSDISTTDGRSWTPLDTVGFNSVAFGGRADAGWAVGAGGRIAQLRVLPR